MRALVVQGCLSIGLVASPAGAIDPPACQGYLEFGGERHELRYAQAVRHPADPGRIWVVLTTHEISVKDAADPARTLERARSNKLRGVRLEVNGTAPRANELRGVLLLGRNDTPEGGIVFSSAGGKYWERLLLGENRIVGKARYASNSGAPGESPPWTFEVSFSAPVFNARLP